jgi:chromate transport protein ChrA
VERRERRQAMMANDDESLSDFVDNLSMFLDDVVLEEIYLRFVIDKRPLVGILADQLNDVRSFRKVDKQLRLIKVICAILTIILTLNIIRSLLFGTNVQVKVLAYVFVIIELARVACNCFLKFYITLCVDRLAGIKEGTVWAQLAGELQQSRAHVL